MRKLLLLSPLLLISITVLAQCPTAPITLSSQAEVDSFAVDYPGCTDLLDNLIIEGTDIVDLSGLGQIISASGERVEVKNNPMLQTMSGLSNIALGDTTLLTIRANAILESISNFTHIGVETFGVEFWGNPLLNDISGVSGLETLEILSVVDCDSLLSFAGLEGLSLLEWLYVDGNEILQEITALSGVSGIMMEVIFNNNPQLIGLQGMEGITAVSDMVLSISNNDSLTNLLGLENITDTETIGIYGNDALTSLDALNLQGDIALINIVNNPLITNLNGLEGLERVDYELFIRDNLSLTDISSLSNLTSTPSSNALDISITNNSQLNDISGIENFNHNEIREIEIKNNPSLTTCNVASVCDFLENGGNADINTNSFGCNSVLEVENNCGIVTFVDVNFLDALINHTPMIDVNEDGLIQVAEALAISGNLNVSNKNISDFTGLEAFINIAGFEGESNTMDFLDLSNNESLTNVVFGNNNQLVNVNFRNGNNMNVTNFQGNNCSNLVYVCVDEVAFAETNFTNIDAQVVFVDDCSILSVSEVDISTLINMYPNPVSEMLYLNVSEGVVLEKSVVYSILGERLLVVSEKKIDVSSFSEGVYFIEVVTNQGSISKKIVKE